MNTSLKPFFGTNIVPGGNKTKSIASMLPAIKNSQAARESNTAMSTLMQSQVTKIAANLQVHQIAKWVSLRIAACMDFTASTSQTVQKFIQNTKEIVELWCGEERKVTLLPIAFHGPWQDASSWKIDDFAWWNKRSNIANGRAEAPIVSGLSKIHHHHFFTSNESSLNIAMVATDEGFMKDPGYQETIQYLKEMNATVIVMLDNPSISAKMMFAGTIESDLGEKVFVIHNARDVVRVAADFISALTEIRTEKIMLQITSDMAPGKENPVHLENVFEKLSKKGHSGLQISNGSKVYLIGKK